MKMILKHLYILTFWLFGIIAYGNNDPCNLTVVQKMEAAFKANPQIFDLINNVNDLPSGLSGAKFFELASEGSEDLYKNFDNLLKLANDLKGANLLSAIQSNPKLIKAWEVCIIDDVVRRNPDKLVKVSKYLDNNPNLETPFKTEFNETAVNRRADFVDRTSSFDDLKKAHDPSGNSSGFTTQGLNISDIPQGVYDDMAAEASALQFLDDYLNSGSTVPQKVQVTAGYSLYKVVPKGGAGPSDFTPYWMKLDELNTNTTTANFEKKLGLPVKSHSAKYDVYRIEVKPGEQANVFESKIASTIENGYTTSGGANQSLVLNRAKWTSPQKLTNEIFPPAN